MTVDVELQITTQEESIIALVMGQPLIPRGVDRPEALRAQLTYMGRAQPSRELRQGEYVYSFVLRIPGEMAVDVGTEVLWNIITSTDRVTVITRFDILTRDTTVDIDPRSSEGKLAIATAIRALQRSPIPRSLWLGE